MIEQGTDVQASEKSGTSALGLAVLSGNTNMVRLIFKSGVDINANIISNPNRPRFTAIHIAASQPKIEIMRYLLMNGVDVNAEGNHGCSPLHITAMNGVIECVELLLTNGANVNSQVETGRNTSRHRSASELETYLPRNCCQKRNYHPPPQTRRQDGWRIGS